MTMTVDELKNQELIFKQILQKQSQQKSQLQEDEEVARSLNFN